MAAGRAWLPSTSQCIAARLSNITNVQPQPFKGGAPKKKVFDGHLRLDPCPRTEKRALLGAPPQITF